MALHADFNRAFKPWLHRAVPPLPEDVCKFCEQPECTCTDRCAWCGEHGDVSLYKGDLVCDVCVRGDVDDQRDTAAKELGHGDD
jgi:hypothetical protein